MGDRTHVTLEVLSSRETEVCKIYGEDMPNSYREAGGFRFAQFEFEEVNYGELEDLEKLEDAGIAYTSTWGSGSDYLAGFRSARFTPDGEIQRLELYEGEEDPPIEELLKRFDNPGELMRYIKQYHRNTTPLPWDNQVEYAKLYLAKRLIGATEDTFAP